jgi:hypothetical protein
MIPGRIGAPRYYCKKCGLVEYCEKPNGMPRHPEFTLKAFFRRHKGCDGKPEYMCGLGVFRQPRGQGNG